MDKVNNKVHGYSDQSKAKYQFSKRDLNSYGFVIIRFNACCYTYTMRPGF